jgi:hypothetical protein
MSNVASGQMFKVTGTSQVDTFTLTPNGVYRVATAKADHGRIMKIFDVATTRLTASGGMESGPVINVPMDQSKTIEAYLI